MTGHALSVAPELRSDVSVLYVDRHGPYPLLVQDWYDAARNAMTYRGTRPVVAHPPCGPWSRLSRLHKHAEEIALAPHAVATVQRCGGVLEHPAGSKVWDACGLPKPDRLVAVSPRASVHVSGPDEHLGYTLEVCQCDWGHPARKRTWLYIVGCAFEALPPIPPPREPTHWASGGRTRSSRQGAPVPPGIKVCSAQQRRRTPTAFAEWLVSVAAQCAVHRVSTAEGSGNG